MNQKQLVFLEYNFIFDPSSTWSSVAQFEADLSSFLSFHGKEGQVLSPIGGYQGKRVILIKSVDPLTEAGRSDASQTSDPQNKLNQFASKYQNPNANKPGRFYKDKGYMVRK